MTENVRPIILRKKKIYAADGHHGGAWKVAYADFVTAMMAFFLLMWLLNATTEAQRKGIADYFSPNIPIAAVSGGGADALAGDSIFTEQTLAKSGTGVASDTGHMMSKEEEKEAARQTAEAQIEALNAALLSENEGLLQHISLKLSPDGLVIELTDTDTAPLFSIGDARPSQVLKQLLKVVTQSFGDVENNIKIVGHTDNTGYVNDNRYSNWELSTDRAHTARRVLMSYGFPYGKVSEVSGKAYTAPLADNPSASQNRRISITILK